MITESVGNNFSQIINCPPNLFVWVVRECAIYLSVHRYRYANTHPQQKLFMFMPVFYRKYCKQAITNAGQALIYITDTYCKMSFYFAFTKHPSDILFRFISNISDSLKYRHRLHVTCINDKNHLEFLEFCHWVTWNSTFSTVMVVFNSWFACENKFYVISRRRKKNARRRCARKAHTTEWLHQITAQ